MCKDWSFRGHLQVLSSFFSMLAHKQAECQHIAVKLHNSVIRTEQTSRVSHQAFHVLRLMVMQCDSRWKAW